MNNTEPLNIIQDPNMLDDVVRFFEAQLQQDEADGIRSPFLSTFTINEVRDSTGLWWPFPRFFSLVDSYGSVNLEPEFSTQRTTDWIHDGYKTVKWYRALKTWRHVIEGNINVWWNSNGVFWLVLSTFLWPNLSTRTTQAPRQVVNWWFLTRIEESQYRTCIYLKWGEYFIMQLYMNAYAPWNVNINGRLKVFCIEDKFVTWQTYSL